jgi:hypothetical protein
MSDLIGNLIGTCCSITNFSFTTGVVSSTTGPQVTGVSPASGLTQVPINVQVVIQFNEPVDALSVGQITLSAGGVPVNVSSYLTNGNQTFVIVPLGTLSPNWAMTVFRTVLRTEASARLGWLLERLDKSRDGMDGLESRFTRPRQVTPHTTGTQSRRPTLEILAFRGRIH